MKLFMAICFLISLCGESSVLASVADYAPLPGKVYFQVLDTDDHPVGGVVVWFNCTEDCSFQEKRRYVSGADGRITIDALNKRWYWCYYLLTIEKEGYDGMSRYLNMDNHRPLSSKDCSVDNPIKIRVRKQYPELEVLVKNGLDRALRVDDDTTICAKGFSILYGRQKQPGDGYVDFFVQPRCDKLKREWVLSLWTTNENSGIICTTNRVFVAPESGYVRRLEISQQEFLHPEFTVYLKTRPQNLYSMLTFAAGDIVAQIHEHRTNFSFGCEIAVNPYGGRILEDDRRQYSHGFYGANEMPGIEQILSEGKYAQRPDMPARFENRRKVKLILQQESQLIKTEYGLKRKIEGIEKQMDGCPFGEINEKTKSLRLEREKVSKQLEDCRRRRWEYDQELLLLYLPFGMTEKDKYPKKTQ